MIVVAGGSGSRIGTLKQFAALDDDGPRVLDAAIAIAQGAARDTADGVVVVVPADSLDTEAERLGSDRLSSDRLGSHAVRVVAGGRSRAESVRAGLAAVPESADVICVHDAARPFATVALYTAVIDAVRAGADGAVPACAVTDTIKIVDDHEVVSTLDRSRLVAVQTPQAFRAAVLRRAHRAALSAPDEPTDDAAVLEAVGARVVVVEGDPDNRKITLADDLIWARERWRRELAGR